MNALVRKFIMFTGADWERFLAFMRGNLKPMAEQKRYLQVVVSEYKASRSHEQNAFMWAGILEPLAEQAFVGGTLYKADIWNELAKELFLPEVNARGMDKWQHLPNGSRRLMMSTSDLNSAEMAAYLDQLAAWAVTEHGVLLPAAPREDMRAASQRHATRSPTPASTGTTSPTKGPAA